MESRDVLAAKPGRKLSEHPVAAEFHPTLNGDLTPDVVPYSWKVKVWWQCSTNSDHVWDALVNNRTHKTNPAGCRFCKGKRLKGQVPFERSLQHKHPKIAAELIPERSGFTASEVLYGSKADVGWWTCPEGHPDYDLTINARTNASHPQGCPYCARKRLAPEHSLASVAPLVAREFLSAVNGTTPEEIFSQDNRRYIWRCSKVPTHRWPASPNNRVGKKSGCPYCSGARVWELNRLSDLCSELISEWDDERNGSLTPQDVSIGSSRKVHWKCPNGEDHRWQARVHKRVAEQQGCRFCAGHEASQTTSLLALRPDLAAQLDADASGISAAELTVASNKEVRWICPINPDKHTWPAKVLNRTLGGTGCPDCNIPGTSAQEIRLAAELSVVLDVDFDLHTVRTTRLERVDIYIAALSLILEFDGSYWHDSTEEADAEKSRRLRTAVDHVVRIREYPLECLDPVHDVVVPFQAAPDDAARIVLDHLVKLEVIPPAAAEEYRRLPSPRAADRAVQILADLRTRADERRESKERVQMPTIEPSDGGTLLADQQTEQPGLW